MTLRAIDRINIDETINIGITGSILTNIDLVKENFVNILSEKIKNFKIYDKYVSSTKGAYYEVMKKINS